MAIRNVDAAEFDDAVKTGISLVDFWAVWCGPCQMQGRILAEEFSPQHPEVNVIKVDVDQNAELAARFGVSSIPTLLVVKNGEVVNSFVGVTSAAELLAAVRAA